ncbi:hypothetical protein GGR50DRAFT_239207 [Xylaria sp. CBS 124048]|nr:hypothetical protein GGR50DRAFT_239207 [Xylaria sp. CBS 124048]
MSSIDPFQSGSNSSSNSMISTKPPYTEIRLVLEDDSEDLKSPSSTGLFLGRPQKLADGEIEILVRKKRDICSPETPAWYAIPFAYRFDESEEECALRASFAEIGLERKSFYLGLHVPVGIDGSARDNTVVLATPAKKMGPEVGYHTGPSYAFVLASKVGRLEVANGVFVDGKRVRELAALLPEYRRKMGVLPKIKRALTVSKTTREIKSLRSRVISAATI